MNSVLILVVALAGLSFIFGGFKPERLTRLLIWVVLAPVAVCLIQGFILSTYAELSPSARVALLILLPFALLLAIQAMFPGSRTVKRIVDALISTFVFLLTLPLRILWRSVRLIKERERHPVRLSPAPVVVGRRPQMQPTNSKETSSKSGES